MFDAFLKWRKENNLDRIMIDEYKYEEWDAV